MDAAAPRPERIGPYEIAETLIHGPRSRTYKGSDPASQRTVALKTLAKDLLDSSSRQRLQDQVSAAARLNHPGIVKVFEYGEDSAWVYVVTEFVEGWAIKERCRIPVADAVTLMVQLLDALDYAHAHGVVHRNLKPSNLLLTRNGLKVDGFGTASLDKLTPEYMSPEQLKDFAGDGRSDLFSAGIIFYELVTGGLPFPGPAETLAERVGTQVERALSEADDGIPQAFDAVCAKALSKAAHDRYQSAHAFRDAMRAAFEGVHGTQPKAAMSHETVLMAVSVPDEPEQGHAAWDEVTLQAVEKQFAAVIGPLAKIIVKKAARKAQTLDQLYSILGNSLLDEEERRAWLAQRNDVAAAALRNKSPQPKAPAPRSPQASPPPPGRSSPPSSPGSGARPAAPPPAPAPEASPSPSVRSSPLSSPGSGARPAAPPPAPAPERKAGAVAAARTEPNTAPPPAVKPEPKPQPDTGIKRQSGQVAAAANPMARIEEVFGKHPDSLAGYLKDDPAQLEDVIHPFAASADALARLHAAKARIEPLVPQNIRFDEAGRASIVNSQATAAGSGSVVSNPRYAVPEIFAEKAGAETNMAAAHVYALGFMFYEILAGRKLFEKVLPQQRTELDWLRWHADMEAKLPPLKTLLPGAPDALSELLQGMTDKHWDKRPMDLGAVCTIIRNVANRSDKTIIMKAPTLRIPPLAAKPQAVPEKVSAGKKKSRKGLLIVLFLILALASGGFLLWQNPDLYRQVLSHLPHRTQTN